MKKTRKYGIRKQFREQDFSLIIDFHEERVLRKLAITEVRTVETKIETSNTSWRNKKTALLFHKCVCAHDEKSHLDSKYECTICDGTKFQKCSSFNAIIFKLLVDFNL